jgi:hypothetical protein
MVDQSTQYSFHDDGELIEVTTKVDAKAESLDVQTTTTTLNVKEKNGADILNVPELYSTVDASKTAFEVRDGELSVTLHKLAPDVKWPTLEALQVAKLQICCLIAIAAS